MTTLVGSATGTTTATVPTHLPGDLIIIFAFNGASTTIPSLPANYTSILTKAGTTCGARIGYRWAAATNDTSGTWTNAVQLTCHVYRPTSGDTLAIGVSGSNASITNTVNYPALTLANTSGSSWIIGFAGVNNTTETVATAPSGMTNRSSVIGAVDSVAGHDTAGGVTSWASTNVTTTGTAGDSISAVVELLLLTPGTQPGQVFHHIGGGGNPNSSALSGNSFKLPFPNSTGAGNCLVLAFTTDAAATVSSISDNINGTWGAASVSAAGGTGNLTSRIYVFPNSGAGKITITVAFSANVVVFQYCMTELYGIATTSPVNSTTASSAFSTTTAAGSFTPDNNDATGGNIIWAYFAKALTSPAHITRLILPGSSFTLLDADIGWADALDSMTHATEIFLQATHAAINPGITSVGESGDQWNSLAIALKLSSGSGTAPAAGIRVNKICHFSTRHLAAGQYKLQCPFTGNVRLLSPAGGNINTPTVTDSEGNTWPQQVSGGQVWYAVNTGVNASGIVDLALSGTGLTTTLSWRIWDISGAATSPVDTGASVAINQDCSGLSTITVSPSPAPTSTTGLMVCNLGLGQGPGTAVTAPSGVTWDSCLYTGETDGDAIDNADILAHFIYTSSGAETWTFTINNAVSNSIVGGFIALTPGSDTFLGAICL